MKLLKLYFGFFQPLKKQLTCFNLSKEEVEQLQYIASAMETLNNYGILDQKQYSSIKYKITKKISQAAFESLEKKKND